VPYYHPLDGYSRPRVDRWSIETQGSLLQVKFHPANPRRISPPTDKTVKHFSRASRLRLLKHIARMDWNGIGESLFITLTYPDQVGQRTKEQRTYDRSRIVQEIERFAKKRVPILWRCEWVPRKSGRRKGKLECHLHLMVFGVARIPWQLLRRWWQRIIEWPNYVRTDIRKCIDGKMAAKYVAKYCAKVGQASSLVNAPYLNMGGRHWGVCRRSLIPKHPQRIELELSPVQVSVLRSVAAAILPLYDERYDSSFTLLGDKAEKIISLWWENCLDDETLIGYFGRVEGGEAAKCHRPACSGCE